MNRGLVYQYADKWVEAEALYSKVEMLVDPSSEKHLEAKESRGWCTVKQGRTSTGIELLKSVDTSLNDIQGHELQKARTLWRLGQAYWSGMFSPNHHRSNS